MESLLRATATLPRRDPASTPLTGAEELLKLIQDPFSGTVSPPASTVTCRAQSALELGLFLTPHDS